MAERISNSFEGGMMKDLSKELRNSNVYAHSVNGRIIHNEDGSLSWENDKGHVASILGYNTDMMVIGEAHFTDFLFLISVGADFTELGIMFPSPDGSATYLRLFNDAGSTDKFGHSKDFPIEAVGIYENESMYRVYWTDNNVEPKSFTFKNTPGVGYEPVTENVFQTQLNPDWKMGTLRFVLQGNGALRTGVYQYTYRMKTVDGYTTPWYPVGTPVPVTDDHPFPDTKRYIEYGMSSSNEISPKSNLLKLEDYDTRYNEIEFAYIFTITEGAILESSIFETRKMDPTGSPMYVEHKITDGIPVDLDEISDVKEFYTRAKTIAVKEDRLWLGNVSTSPIINIPEEVFANLQVRPVVKAYREDRHHVTLGEDVTPHLKDQTITAVGSPPLPSVQNPDEYVRYNTPFYYIGRTKSAYYKTRYQKANGDYVGIVNEIENPLDGNQYWDYASYKGTYMSHDRVGYWRDETYRFGIVFFDKKGKPFPAIHLADVKFPGQNGEPTDNWTIATSPPVLNQSIRNEDLTGQTGASGDGSADCVFRAERILKDGTFQDVGTVVYDKEDFTLMTGYTGRRKNTERTTRVRSALDVPLYSDDTADGLGHKSHIRILGVKFSGIDVGVEIPELGAPLHNFISGFSIVRVDRKGDDRVVRNQGLLFQANRADQDNTEIFPHPGIGQYHLDPASNSGRRELFAHYTKNPTDDTKPYKTIPEDRVFTYDTPDYGVDVENVVPSGSIMKYVANFRHKREISGTFDHADRDDPFVKLTTNLEDSYRQAFMWNPNHFVLKCTETMNSRSYDSGAVGQDSRFNSYNAGEKDGVWRRYNDTEDATVRASAVYTSTQTINNFAKGKNFTALCHICHWPDVSDPLDVNFAYNQNHLEIQNYIALYGQNILQYFYYRRWHGTKGVDFLDGGKAFLQAWSAQASQVLYLERKYHSALGEGGGFGDHFAFNVYNYTRPNDGQYGGKKFESLEKNIFITANHFQPINQTVLNDINKGGGVYEFDEMEVWGGDCYATTHAYLRLYPKMLTAEDTDCEVDPENVGWTKQDHPDYSLAIVHPIESNYNLALRLSNRGAFPTVANVGVFPGRMQGVDNLIEDDYPSGFIGYFGRPDEKYEDGLYHYDDINTCTERAERTNINASLLYTDKSQPYTPLPSNFIPVFDYPARWAWSNEKKPHGEKVDRFREFEELSNGDLNASFGQINGNGQFGDNMYSIQANAFGRLRIRDRALISANQADSLVLGEAGIMDGIDYISRTYGTQHRESIVQTNGSLYWVDANMRKILRFSQDGLTMISDSDGLHNYVQPYLEQMVRNYSPAGHGGITSGFDYNNGDVYFTFKIKGSTNLDDFQQKLDETGSLKKPLGADGVASGGISDLQKFDVNQERKSLTLVYSENVGAFTTEYTFYPVKYMNHGKHFYSVQQIFNDTRSTIWQHNAGERGFFHGNKFYSVLNFIVNKYPNMIKKFDSNYINCNEPTTDILQYVRCVTEDQTQVIDVYSESVNAQGGYSASRRAKFRNGLYRFPIRERGESQRLTGKLVELVYYVINNNDEVARFTSVDTMVRFQNRI